MALFKASRCIRNSEGTAAAVEARAPSISANPWGAVRFSVCLHLIDDDVKNVAPPQIAPSSAPAKDLRF